MAIKSPHIPPDPPRQTSTKPYNTRSNAKVNAKATSPAEKQPSPAEASQAQPTQNASDDEDPPQSVFEATALFMIADRLDKLIAEYEMPERLGKTLAKISKFASKNGIKAGKKEMIQVSVEDIRELCQDVFGEIFTNFKDLEEKMVKIVSNQDQILAATKEITKEAAGMNKVAAAVSSKASQLESTVNTYKDALLKAPPQPNPLKVMSEASDPALERDTERKSRQVLLDLPDNQLTTSSEFEIRQKVYDVIHEISNPQAPKDIKIQELSKLRNSGILILFDTKEAADWIQGKDTDKAFTACFAPGASIRRRQYLVLVSKIPITLDPTMEAHVREIEEANRIQEHAITKIKWIKPQSRRNPNQRFAHATFSFSSTEAANTCIRDSILVQGVKTFPSKLKQDPTQCLKCRKWGHYASGCKELKDTCGTCGGDHWTNTCSNNTKKYCVPCGTNSHSSWDRQCPEFLRRCAQYDKTHPENTLKYFPTKEAWTKVIRPAKIPFNERFPAHYVVASLPPPPGTQQIT